MALDWQAVERDIFDADTPGTTAHIRQAIVEAAPRYGVDPALALSLAQTESNFNPQAVSPTNVTGLFQVTVPTGAPYGQTAANRTDWQVSMHAGLSELGKQLKASGGNVPQALSRYGDPNDPQYAQKVMENYRLQQDSLPQRVAGEGAAPPTDWREVERQIFGEGEPGTAQPDTPQPGTPQPGMPQPGTPQPPPGLAPAMPLATEDVGALPGMGMTGRPATAVPPEMGAPGVTPQMVVDIEKASAPGPAGGPPGGSQGTLAGGIRGAEVGAAPLIHERTIDEGPGGYAEAGKTLGAMGTEAAGAYGGAVTGARIGSAFGPVGTLIGGTLGAGIGAYGMHQGNKALGLQPGEPGVMPQDLQDWLSLTAPMVPGAAKTVAAPVRPLARWTRGGRAVLAAGQAAEELTQHEAAITRLQALPARYQPATPSRDLYTEFTRRAGTAPVTTAPIHTVLADPGFQNNLRYTPRLQRVAADLGALGPDVPAARLHDLLKQVTTAGRTGDSTTRYLSGRLAQSVNQAMQTSIPGERPLLQQANVAWRQEQGVRVLENLFREGSGILRIDPSIPGGRDLILSPSNLLNQTARNRELPHWFTPAEYQALQADIRAFAGTPAKPGQAAVIPEHQEFRFNALRDVWGPLGLGTAFGGGKGAVIGPAAMVSYDVANWALARAMVSERLRGPLLQWMRQGGGPMRPELAAGFAALVAAYHGEQGGMAPSGIPSGSTQGQYRAGDYNAPAPEPERPVPGSTRGQYQRAY